MPRRPLLLLPLLLAGCSGGSHRAATTPAAVVRPAVHHRHAAAGRSDPAWRALRLPPVGPGPVPGYLLIADRNNDRVLIVSPAKRVVWRYDGLRGPDDAFFTPGYRSVITNEEFDETLTEVSLRTRRPVWRYGHAGSAGSGPGYLNSPDDGYRLRGGGTTVADIRNCRIVQLAPSGRIARILGGSCAHDPPRGFASPNGDTPLPDGGLLVTEIGGWIDRISPAGELVWSVRSPVSYPSDAQLLPNGRILVSSFTVPGRIVELTTSGRVTWSFGDAQGPNLLRKPSLAVRFPNGMIAANDDYGHRVIVIDPRTKRIVWQYGHTGIASSAPGYLSKPDGLDLLPAARVRGPAAAPRREASLRVRRIGSLPAPASRLAAVALPDGRVLAAGGLVRGTSTDEVLLGPAAGLRVAGRLPAPTHDAAAAFVRGAVYVFGGGTAVSTDARVRVDAATGAARPAGRMIEPLSDLGAVSAGRAAYLVGGYTGARRATGILRFVPGRGETLAGRLPVPLRYAGVAALGGRVYVAGGVTPRGASRAVYAFDPGTGRVDRVATLPRAVAHVALAALAGRLVLVGGGSSAVLEIDPVAGRVTRAGRLPAVLADPAAVTVGGRVVVLGGGTDAVYELTAR